MAKIGTYEEEYFEDPVAFVRLDLRGGPETVLQRRTEAAPSSPNKLQFFGGFMEEGETLMGAAKRELGEETDLPVEDMEFEEIGLFFVPKGRFRRVGFRRVVGLVKAEIHSADFQDFEGAGPEVWTPQVAYNSGQLVTSVKYLFEKTIMVQPVSEA